MTDRTDQDTKGHTVYLPSLEQLHKRRDRIKSGWNESTRKSRLVTSEIEPLTLEPQTILMPDGSVMQ